MKERGLWQLFAPSDMHSSAEYGSGARGWVCMSHPSKELYQVPDFINQHVLCLGIGVSAVINYNYETF